MHVVATVAVAMAVAMAVAVAVPTSSPSTMGVAVPVRVATAATASVHVCVVKGKDAHHVYGQSSSRDNKELTQPSHFGWFPEALQGFKDDFDGNEPALGGLVKSVRILQRRPSEGGVGGARLLLH